LDSCQIWSATVSCPLSAAQLLIEVCLERFTQKVQNYRVDTSTGKHEAESRWNKVSYVMEFEYLQPVGQEMMLYESTYTMLHCKYSDALFFYLRN